MTRAIRNEEADGLAHWEVTGQWGDTLARHGARCDASDAFVAENYEALRARGVFSMQVPASLGGGGACFDEMCTLLRELAAFCPSTALALSMHQHLVSAMVWRWQRGQRSAEPLLREVARSEVVLVSTGASDWIDSSGDAVRVSGGYRVSGRKIFGSGCPAGAFLMTSTRFDDPDAGPRVLHSPVPLDAPGVARGDNWIAHGMRGTGSHDVVLTDVFVPHDAVWLSRPRGEWHSFFDLNVGVALPTVMSAYRGLAEAAAAHTTRCCRGRVRGETPELLGEMGNALAVARLAHDDMLRIVENLGFEPDAATSDAILVRKTLVANACIRTVEKAVEALGGAAYYRSCPLERWLRDVRAAHFHPLPEKRQLRFSGRRALGLDPVSGEPRPRADREAAAG